MDKIHQIVKDLRLKNNMTLKEVASRLGTTEATIQRYESAKGIKAVPYDKIIAYSELFNVTPTYLITGYDDSKNKGTLDINAEDDFLIISMYHQLSDPDKDFVKATMEHLINKDNK